jgi:hypothetical protein
LVHLVKYHLEADQPLDAQEYARRARRAKPLDRAMTTLLWATHVAAARFFALQGRFDAARAEFQTADALEPDRRDDYDVLARKAALEFKAGCAAEGCLLIEQAVNALEEPAPLWLVLMIEASRYGLPQDEIAVYEQRWGVALKKRCRSATAGTMCKLLTAHRRAFSNYQLPEDLVKQLVAYVRRCTRVKWKVQDLRDACEFLQEVDERDLLRKFANLGLKKFRESVFFHVLDGRLEMERGPNACNHVKAIASLHRAIQLAENSNDPQDRAMLEGARRLLTVLEEYQRRHLSYLFGGDDDNNDDDDYDDGGYDQDDDDEYGDGNFAPNIPVNVIRAMCERLGIDPDEFFADRGGNGPLPNPFGEKGRQNAKRPKR